MFDEQWKYEHRFTGRSHEIAHWTRLSMEMCDFAFEVSWKSFRKCDLIHGSSSFDGSCLLSISFVLCRADCLQCSNSYAWRKQTQKEKEKYCHSIVVQMHSNRCANINFISFIGWFGQFRRVSLFLCRRLLSLHDSSIWKCTHFKNDWKTSHETIFEKHLI